jgi:hypothetical protein
MPRKSNTAVATIGIDPGKNTLHLVGLDARGGIVLREKVARARIISWLANVPPCLIGIRKSHRVMVMPDGFAWNGEMFDSLSEIAFAITGTKWNGPRFFGLRDRRPHINGRDPK